MVMHTVRQRLHAARIINGSCSQGWLYRAIAAAKSSSQNLEAEVIHIADEFREAVSMIAVYVETEPSTGIDWLDV